MTTTTKPDDTWRDVLREQGRTMAWLADRTGVSARTVYAYSIGTRRAPEEWLERVAMALGVPMAALSAPSEAA